MKYVCPICGYIYDEQKEKIPFSQLDSSWVCPLCGAAKSTFKEMSDAVPKKKEINPVKFDNDMEKLSPGVVSAIFSNLARGCEKQYKPDEMKLFAEIADYFASITPNEEKANIDALSQLISDDLQNGYPTLRSAAEYDKDRGTQRICVWGEKVTNIADSILKRYKSEGDELLKNTQIWVCSVCGFIYIGDTPPSLCPVCKVPNWKFDMIEGRADL